VSEAELPLLLAGVMLLVVSTPFLLLALAAATRMLPRRDAPPFRWSAAEGLAIVAAPFVTVMLLQALLATGAVPVGPQPVEPVGPVDPVEPTSGALVLLTMVASQLVLGVAAVLAVVIARRRFYGPEALGFRVAAPPRAFLAILVVYVPLFVFARGLALVWLHVSRTMGWEEEQEILRLILDLRGGELAVAVLVAVVVGPFVEELVFRGFLLSFLVQTTGRTVGFLLTAVLFALPHGVAGFPILLALSLFLCWLQVRTRSIWPSYAAHALNNAVTLGLALAVGAG
jgi:membrane protease YdiL (CAAX protease family)